MKGGNGVPLTLKKRKYDMDKFWEVSAEKYLSNVFYRREIDAKAATGDAFAAAVVATAAAIAK